LRRSIAAARQSIGKTPAAPESADSRCGRRRRHLSKLPFEGNLWGMGKSSTHYSLNDIIAELKKRAAGAFTKSALNGGWNMGLTTSQMIDVVCSLPPRRLY
jgi:hypothetical protein